jgi:type II secretory pathway component PulC
VGSVDDMQRLMALAHQPEVQLDVLRKGRRRALSARAVPRAEPVAA